MRCLGFFYKGTAVDSARVENSCWLQKLFKNAIKLFPNNIKSDNTHQGMSISLAQAVSHAVNNFNGTEIEIWASLVPVGNTEKRVGPILSNFGEKCFHGSNFFSFKILWRPQ